MNHSQCSLETGGPALQVSWNAYWRWRIRQRNEGNSNDRSYRLSALGAG
jgi:hypothetical protein